MRNQTEEAKLNNQSDCFNANMNREVRKELDANLHDMIDSSLLCPDMEKMRRQRKARAREVMETFNPTIAHRILANEKFQSREERAAVDIQRIFRGYLARKQFVYMLYEKYEKEEAEMEERRRQQVMEGAILVETYHLEQELNDRATLRRNKTRSTGAHATTIQRAWKAYKRRKSGTDVPSDPIYIGEAEQGYNEIEFPSEFPVTSKYHMHEHQHEPAHAVDINDIFDDSLENEEESDYDDSGRSQSPDIVGSFQGDYLVENEFDGTFESMNSKFTRFRIDYNAEARKYDDSFRATLPEPTTDWDTIESVLTNESGLNSPEDEEDIKVDELTRKFSSGQNLQLCFVDDNGESDPESDPEVKVYVVDDDRNMEYTEKSDLYSLNDNSSERGADSRDSGCVPGDLIDMNIDYVTDFTPNQLKHEPLPAEEAKRVLLSLQLHEEHDLQCQQQAEEKKRQSVIPNSASFKTVEELILLKNELEEKVQVVSNQLVECLMQRDNLHAEQESLLMEVEDLTKLAQRHEQSPTSQNSTKVKVGK